MRLPRSSLPLVEVTHTHAETRPQPEVCVPAVVDTRPFSGCYYFAVCNDCWAARSLSGAQCFLTARRILLWFHNLFLSVRSCVQISSASLKNSSQEDGGTWAVCIFEYECGCLFICVSSVLEQWPAQGVFLPASPMNAGIGYSPKINTGGLLTSQLLKMTWRYVHNFYVQYIYD